MKNKNYLQIKNSRNKSLHKIICTLFFAACILLAGLSNSMAATLTVTSNTNWSTLNPAAADVIIVKNGATLTVDAAAGVCTSLQVGGKSGDGAAGNAGNGFLVFNANKQITISNTLTIGSTTTHTGSIDMTSGGTLIMNGGTITINNAGTWTPGTGTFQYGATITIPTAFFTTYNNLTIAGGTVTMGANRTVNGNLLVSGGTLSFGGGLTLTLNGNFTQTGTAGTDTPSGTNGIILFNKTGTQTYSVASFTNIKWIQYTVASTSTLQLLSNLNVYGSTSFPSVFLVNGTLDASSFVCGNIGSGGCTFTLASGATIITKNTLGLVSGTSGTVSTSFATARNFNTAANYVFNGTSAQVTSTAMPSAFVSAGSVTINNSAGVTLSQATAFGTGTFLNLDNGAFTNGALLTMNNGSTIDRDLGTLASVPTFAATVNVIYSGTTAVTTGNELPTGTANLGALTINKSGGVTLNADAQPNGLVTLTSGNLILGIKNLTLTAAAAAIAGSPFTNTKMIIADGGGELRKLCTSNAQANYTFPVGDGAASANGAQYSPIVISAASATTYSSAYIGVKVSDGKHPGNQSTANYLTRYWTLTPSGITGTPFTVTATATYSAVSGEDIAGTESSIKGAQLSGTFNQATNPWKKYIALSSNTLTATTATLVSGTASAFTGITNAAPSVGISGTTAICNGGNTTLTAAGTGDATFTYSWSSGSAVASSGSLSPATSTTYTVTATDGNGITATNSQLVTVNAQPSGPTINVKSPNLSAVCAGQTVSATFNAGSGGTGCSDDYTVSIDGGIATAYTPGNAVGGAATSSIVIQGRRASCTVGAGCTGTSYVTLASWTVNAQPVGPTINVKSPNLSAICAGTTVSATFNVGSGGTGCSDDYTVSIDGGTATAYTPGNAVGGAATSSIVIQGRRASCTTGAGCTGTSYVTLASWTVNPQPVGPTLNLKSPLTSSVCAGTTVSATFNVGSGGTGCSDDYTVSIDGGTATAYTPGNAVGGSATSSIIILGRRASCTAGAGCTGTSYVTLASWTVNAYPVADDPADVTACDSYTLPALAVGNYYTGTGGTGTALSAGNNITSSQTIYVYAETGTTPNCTDENSFVVTINTTPVADDPADVTACDSYTLPSLTVGNYFTGTGGTGTALSAGNNITSSQTIYVYAETGTTPNCTDENSFVVTINTTPVADDPADVTACDSYTLPALAVGNYFTGTGGTGTALSAGNNITSSQTIYVYAETGTTPNCSNENSFVVTINTTPVADDPADITACDSYTLPSLAVGNYFTGTGGTGTALSAGNNITSSQTIYVYAETGTTPNCTNENSFTVTINTSPVADDPADVTACDSYTLPALAVGNYFTGTSGTGTALSAGNSITSSQTIYVYAETGTTPNCTNENSFEVTINTNPVVTITSANTTICSGNSTAISGTVAATGAWSLSLSPAGSTSGSGASFSVLVNPASTTTYSIGSFSDATGCPATLSGSTTVTVISAPITGSVSALKDFATNTTITQVCNGQVIEVEAAGAITGTGLQYGWSKGSSSGALLFSTVSASGPWTATATTSGNKVWVQFGALGSGYSGYRVCVQAFTACQSTVNYCPWLQGTLSTPASITGNTVVCPPSTQNYSAAASAGAFQYRWTFQPDAGAVQLLTVGTNVETLAIPNYTTSGKLCVIAELACGAGSAGTPRCITLAKQLAPVAPMAGNSPVCPGTTNNYSIPVLNGATSYTWTSPGSFTNVTSTSINVTFPSPYNGSGQVCVTANGSCSAPVTRCKSITSSTPLVPASLTGPLAGVCTPATVGYTIPSVSGATGYTWTYPTGPSTYASVSGNTTFSFSAPAGLVNGTVSVVAENNNCTPTAVSGVRSVPVKGAPARPASITTVNGQPFNGCPTLFVTPFSSGLSYLWSTSLGAGAPIDPPNPNTTGQIVITWGTGTGNVNVTASNTCGSSGSLSQSFTGQTGGCRLAGETAVANNNSNFAIYPNPAHDRITVEMLNDKAQNAVVKITDLSGRLISAASVNMTVGTSYTEVDLTHLAKGPYILSVENSAGVNRQRIVVE